MNPQIICAGLNSRMRSHIDIAPERSHGWNSFERSAALSSKTPSHFAKNGHSSDVDPEFITSTAVRPAAADELDAAPATGPLRVANIVQK